MTEEEYDRNKKIAHYSNAVAAWFNTNLEFDKSFLILSMAAIGFIVSLLRYFTIRSFCSLIFSILSISSFFICIILTLFIYTKNASMLEKYFDESDKEMDQVGKTLKILTLANSISFILGLIFFLIYVGFFIGYSYQH